MKLKNYTSSVPADRTIMEIERLLAEFGADKIMKNMLSDGKVTSLVFQYQNKPYKLPVDYQGVNRILTQTRIGTAKPVLK